MTTIGARVKAAREQCGIHQAELARRVGCSVNALSMLEHDAITDPRASRIIGIAKALKVSADYLLGLQEAPQAEKPAATRRRKTTPERPSR